jgi:hypothetical protein
VTPQTIDDLRRAVAFGLSNGKTNMIADLAPLHALLGQRDDLLAVCKAVLRRLTDNGMDYDSRAALEAVIRKATPPPDGRPAP